MQLDIFQSLTIINSLVIAVVPLVFFKRQKLQEIKYEELMELNTKTHDITTRMDKSLVERNVIDVKDYDRLDYLITRYKKHSRCLSEQLNDYRELCKPFLDNKSAGGTRTVGLDVLKSRSENIRDSSDRLLN